MAGFIAREFIDELLVRIDIVDLINSHVPLKKTGINYSSRCPFHDEKTPSFSVSPKRQAYHCFGCGVGGNAISFLMEYAHLEFVEAVEDLAAFIGIDVPKEVGNYPTTSRKTDDLAGIYLILQAVAKFYAQQLKSNPVAQIAIQYLKDRGLSGIIARDFQLGYAPNSWDELKRRFEVKLLIQAGLVIKKEDGASYDRFRGRLMFPIRDKRNRVIGFGARVLDDSLPKYLNSPETTVFSKSNEVYGLHELLQYAPKPTRILIVEGYMDVIALAQFGVHYAVATLGTAVSKIHLDILFRFTPELVLCFDGDVAGKKAAWRGIEAVMPALRDGRQIKIMILPAEQDPDSLIRAIGHEKFLEKISQAQALSEYFFEYIIAALDLSTLEGRAGLVQQAQPHLERLPKGVFKDMMLSKLRQLGEVPELVFSEKPTILHNKLALSEDKGEFSPARVAIGLLIQNPTLSVVGMEKIAVLEIFEYDSNGLKMLKNILATIRTYQPTNMGRLLELYRDTNEEKVLRLLSNWDFLLPEAGIEKEFLGAITRLQEQEQEHQFEAMSLLTKHPAQTWSLEEKQQLIKSLQQND